VATEADPRYSFPPLAKRGVLLGLDGIQLATIGVGAFVALVVHAVLQGTPGTVAAVLVFGFCAVGAIWPCSGRPIVAWTPVVACWIGTRLRGAILSDAPLDGTASALRERTGPAQVTAPPGIALIFDRGGPGESDLGLVHDRLEHRWAAVVPVAGRSFSLMDSIQQVQVLEAWRAVLGAVARPGSPVARLQWIVRTSPSPSCAVPRGAQPAPAVDSYLSFAAATASSMLRQEAWLVVAVTGGRREGGRSIEILRRELRLLQGQLRSVDIAPGAPLGIGQLRGLVAAPFRGAPVIGRYLPDSGSWPMALREGWGSVQADGNWHATFWISEWPRVDVGPDFLGPLLTSTAQRTVSLIMAPVATERALREARSARTADVADAELRSRAGFLSSARREKEAEGAVQREAELAAGHSEFRFSGYVTVSDSTAEGLMAACAEVEHSAQSSRLELRRLFGRQREALTWTQPFGRGLR
jgi:hypothetical protein